MRTLTETVKAARAVSTPLLAVSTPDQLALIHVLGEAINGKAPRLRWDALKGLQPLNTPGEAALAALGDDAQASMNPAVALDLALRLPERCVLFMLNAHRFLNDPVVATGVLNLRDVFKGDQRTLIMLGPAFELPGELTSDVVLLEDALPTDEQLAAILATVYDAAGLGTPAPALASSAVDAARGLSSFAAEQVYAMALRKDGLDITDCWERKRVAVNQTKGLLLTRGGEGFEALGGLENATDYAKLVWAGNRPPRVVVFMDEMEKSLAGSSGAHADTSGVSSDALGVILREMEDKGWDGMIAVGPPGSGKTAFAKAAGATFGVPTVTLDLGALKGQYVGNSEANIRAAMRVIEGLGGDSVFVIGTCNRLDSLPPELRRRFRSGIWYFDLPTKAEREAIWKIMLKRYGLDAKMERPADTDWTGAEIRNVCDIAWRLKCSLVKAASFIVPVCIADPAGIERLRASAAGTFTSASEPGPYKKPSAAVAAVQSDGKRKISPAS